MSENSASNRPSSRLADGLGSRSGMIFGQYELVRRIGSGGMAEVYEAVHRGLKKTVAIKVLLPDVAENADLRARFLREGEAASRIQHPHVVDVTDVGEHEGVPFLVMELLSGDTLTRVIREHRQLSLARALDVLLPIAAALSEAHRKGVVHRDLKPDNIFIARTSGGKVVPKLLDFGVSKMTTAGIPSETGGRPRRPIRLRPGGLRMRGGCAAVRKREHHGAAARSLARGAAATVDPRAGPAPHLRRHLVACALGGPARTL
jgi:serine/threonine protein kinase